MFCGSPSTDLGVSLKVFTTYGCNGHLVHVTIFCSPSHRGSAQNLALIVKVVLDMFELVDEQQTEDRQLNDY